MARNVEGTVELANLLIEAIAKNLKELYGSYWNFTIDVTPGADVKTNFTLKIVVSRKH